MDPRKKKTSFGIICSRLRDGTGEREYLMLRRKHTYSYMFLISGRFEDERLPYLVSTITPDERTAILTTEFRKLWEGAYSAVWNKQYPMAIRRFRETKWRSYFEQFPPTYTEPEWIFPKGRKNKHEEPYKCAIREFEEETGCLPSEYRSLGPERSYVDEYVGDDGIIYKTIYFLAEWLCPYLPTNYQAREASGSRFLTLGECFLHTRPFHTTRIPMLQRIELDLAEEKQ